LRRGDRTDEFRDGERHRRSGSGETVGRQRVEWGERHTPELRGRRAVCTDPPGGHDPARPARRGSAREKPPAAARIPSTITVAHHTFELEAHILCLLLRQPDALHQLDRTLLENQLSRLGAQDFEHTDHQLLARKVIDSLEQDELDAHQYILRDLPESLQVLAQTLLEPMPLGEPTSDQLIEDLLNAVIHLREARISESINQLRYLQEELQEQGEMSRGPYHEMVIQYTQTLARLNRALSGPLKAKE